MDEYKVSRSTANRLMNAFEEEVKKADSKIPRECLIHISDRVRTVDEGAFKYFLLNKGKLADTKARKRLSIYNHQFN